MEKPKGFGFFRAPPPAPEPEHEWTKDGLGKWVCRYNEGVSCKDRRCDRCGWNPLVAKIRQLQMELDILKGVFNETHICTKR